MRDHPAARRLAEPVAHGDSVTFPNSDGDHGHAYADTHCHDTHSNAYPYADHGDTVTHSDADSVHGHPVAVAVAVYTDPDTDHRDADNGHTRAELKPDADGHHGWQSRRADGRHRHGAG
jgi:hypothetical protein